MENKNVETTLIPVITELRMMSDEEWNKLAYKNWLERNGSNGEYSSSR